MNIAVSGLAAAGKTTHARLLARWLDFDYVSADESWPGRMRFVQGVGVERHGAKTDGDSSVEVVINTLVDALRTRDRTVFDSWAAPWLPASVPCIRVWIESTLDSRAGWWRAAQEPYGPRPALEDCRRVLSAKDADTARRHRTLLGAGFGSDRSVFDVTVDGSNLFHQDAMGSVRRATLVVHEALKAGISECLTPDCGGGMHSALCTPI